MRKRNTIEFLGIWEQLYNPAFNPVEFERFRSQAGLNRFSMSPKKWIEATGAIGLYAKSGRYGGTYAHKDIAFEFGSWLSPEFKLYLIKEFQRLKDEESRSRALDWSFQRTLAKVNYKIHTDAIKDRLIPPRVTKAQASAIYATEADLLNVALFGITAAQWRQGNSEQAGNMRDTATLEQLVVLSNLESINAVLINQGLASAERLVQLNEIAINQMRSLTGSGAIKRLANPDRKAGKIPLTSDDTRIITTVGQRLMPSHLRKRLRQLRVVLPCRCGLRTSKERAYPKVLGWIDYQDILSLLPRRVKGSVAKRDD